MEKDQSHMKRNKQLAKHHDPSECRLLAPTKKRKIIIIFGLACSRAGRANIMSVEARIVFSRSLVMPALSIVSFVLSYFYS